MGTVEIVGGIIAVLVTFILGAIWNEISKLRRAVHDSNVNTQKTLVSIERDVFHLGRDITAIDQRVTNLEKPESSRAKGSSP